MKETPPVFLEADTGEAAIQLGRTIWNRTLMLRKEAVLKDWSKGSRILFINT